MTMIHSLCASELTHRRFGNKSMGLRCPWARVSYAHCFPQWLIFFWTSELCVWFKKTQGLLVDVLFKREARRGVIRGLMAIGLGLTSLFRHS